jgi:hypothetical protein
MDMLIDAITERLLLFIAMNKKALAKFTIPSQNYLSIL